MAQPFAPGAVMAIADDHAFETSVHQREAAEQDVHALSPNQLAGVNDAVAVIEGAFLRERRRHRHGRMRLDSVGLKSVSQQLVAHVMSGDDHAFKPSVKIDLAELVRVAHPTNRQGGTPVARQCGAAAKHAEQGGGPGANMAA